LLTGFGFVISAIMANRLMMNVRENFYLLSEGSIVATRKSTPFSGGTGRNNNRNIITTFDGTTIPSSIRSPLRSSILDIQNSHDHMGSNVQFDEDDFELKTFSENRGF
jgi:hypothetical protein